MLRYYVIAAGIVIGTLLIALRFQHAGRELQVAAVQTTGSPSAARAQAKSRLVPVEVSGNAPWAMSALPECFEQVFSARGKPAYVDGQLPRGAVAVSGYAALRSADCRLEISPGRALVVRGKQQLVIPPVTQFYRWPDEIGFVRRDAAGAELRVYRLRGGGKIVLVFGDGP